VTSSEIPLLLSWIVRKNCPSRNWPCKVIRFAISYKSHACAIAMGNCFPV